MTLTPVIHDSSARDSSGVSPADLLKQIAVFRYCEEVLQQRGAFGSRDWLWQVKRKVATFCRKSLESRVADEDAPLPVDLSDVERRQLVRCHPLLSHPSPVIGEPPVAPDWLVALRSRVAGYVTSLRTSRGDRNADN